MADIEKRIEIVTTYRDETNNKLNKTINTVKNMKNGLDKTTKTVTTFGKNGKLQIDKITQSVKRMGTETSKATLQSMRTFRMFGLSMMVAGYSIKRVFQDIATSAVSAFQQIISTNGFMNTNINVLTASWEYLKFTIGSAINTALGPLMPMILNIVNAVGQWIQQHPKLVAWIILGGLVLGTFLGILGLLIYVLSGVMAVMGPVTGAVEGLGGAFALLSNPVGWVIAGILLLLAIFPNLRKVFKDVLGDVWGIFKNFFLLIYDIITGNWQDVWIRFQLIMAYAAKGIVDIITFIATAIADVIRSLIDNVLGLITFLATAIDKMTAGTKFATHLSAQVAGIKSAVDNAFNNAINNLPTKTVSADIQANIDKLNGQLSSNQGTTSASQSGAFPDLTSTGLYGQQMQTVGQGSSVNITQNINNSGVGKDTASAIQSGINDAFQKAYQTAKSYQT